MKFLLSTLNSKYVHTSLSLRCLYSMVKDDFDVTVREFTINDNYLSVISSVYREKADVICFSCHIWNFDKIINLCENIKKANKNIFIVLGGPEVTYTAKETLKDYPFVDAVVVGEGEITIKELFFSLEKGLDLSSVDGLAYRIENEIIKNRPRDLVANLDELPFVYDDSIDEYKNKIIYYESSRGCPFSCSYCLSGEKGKVRYLSLDRVKRDLDFFISHNVPLVKFVDRTFNANKKRTKEIFKYIIDNSKNTKFHMELAGDLIDDEIIDILSKAPRDILQFEIGVQTTNPRTMEEINRKISWNNLRENIIKLLQKTTIHIHLDLIAGLPFEDFESFKKSFNDVFVLRPHVLQLGFLKLLKGANITENQEKYGYNYMSLAPYEVINNDFITYDQILDLHDIDFVFDRFYNSGSFETTIDLILKEYESPFEMFYELSKFFKYRGFMDKLLSKYDLYDVFYEFSKNIQADCTDSLKYDFLKNIRSHNLPEWCKKNITRDFTDTCYEILKNEEFKKDNLPHYFDVPAKAVIKHVHFEQFTDRVLLFDYKTDKIIDVSNFFD